MKKITGVLKAKGFEDCNFEFYVDDNMTEKQIEMEVYKRAGFSLDWTEENDGWKSTNIELPKYGVPCQIRYKDGREDTAVLSSYVGWHEIGVLYAVKEPDFWRYMIDDEKIPDFC